MDDDEDPAESLKTKLRPRRPGENIKVAETVLKRRERNLQAAAERAQSISRLKRAREDYKKGKLSIIRPETLLKRCIVKRIDKERLIRAKHGAKRVRDAPPGAGVLIVARNGRMGGTRETKRTLRDLGLSRRNNMIFHLPTKEVLVKLNMVRPFAFWGTPSFKTIFNIMHKKARFREPGTGKDGKDGCVELSDNSLIEKHLGDLGILCTEDLAHVIHTKTKDFEAVTKRLWCMPFDNPKKANGMVRDKDFIFGPLGTDINAKLAALLGE